MISFAKLAPCACRIGQEAFIELYLDAFTTGQYAQHITPEQARETLARLMAEGWGIVARDEERPVGCVWAFDAIHLPAHELDPTFDCASPGKTLYIAEVMVASRYRGLGIAKTLIADLLCQAALNYTEALIRVWDTNIPALTLYRQMGFEPTGGRISQTKYRNEDEMFVMNKLYLHKKL